MRILVITFRHLDFQLSENNEQRQALNLQMQSRINLELSQLLPRLHGLANLVNDIPTLEPSANLLELGDVLNTLNGRLQSLVSPGVPQSRSLSSIAPLNTNTHLTAVPAHVPQGMKRKRPLLLPPSPERMQKQKDSRAPY